LADGKFSEKGSYSSNDRKLFLKYTEVLVAIVNNCGGSFIPIVATLCPHPLFFLKDSIHFDKVLCSSEYDSEGGQTVSSYCQPHFVVSYAHLICLGGHYYLTTAGNTSEPHSLIYFTQIPN
jgi:hypothetical protein